MPGIRPALIADDHVMLLGEQINEFSFCLVSPLQTDNASTRQRKNLEKVARSTGFEHPNVRPRQGGGQGRRAAIARSLLVHANVMAVRQ
jgi:ABC-type polar amino acid transport system ATPase subunit